jgi:hypothetical protein
MGYVLSEVYQAPSSSGGKVWGIPGFTQGGQTTQSFNAQASRFNEGRVTINDLSKPKSVNDLVGEKLQKGYQRVSDCYIDYETGDVYFGDLANKTSTLERHIKVENESTLEIKGGGLFNF